MDVELEYVAFINIEILHVFDYLIESTFDGTTLPYYWYNKFLMGQYMYLIISYLILSSYLSTASQTSLSQKPGTL